MAQGNRDVATIWTAILCVGGLGIALIWFFNSLGLQQTQWDRAIYLLNGIEAVAFAAAGFLFGSKVNRERAEQAEKRADEVEKKNGELETTATRGRQLAAQVLHATSARGPQKAKSTIDGVGERDPDPLAVLALEAQKLVL